MRSRLINLVSAICFTAATAIPARAIIIVTPPAGTYTYNFGLPLGASFTMSLDAPFGTPNANFTDFAYFGSPDPLYAPVEFVTTSGNNTYHYVADAQTYDGGFDVELALQYNSIINGYNDILVFTFIEPVSFWAALGPQTFTNGSGEFIDGYQGTFEDPFGPSYAPFFGELPEGAFYAYYNSGLGIDPPCDPIFCTLTTTFTPAVSSTPEPSSLALLSTGAAGLLALYRRRRS